MTLVSAIIKKVCPKGEVGIEVEAEGKNLYPIDSQYWRTEKDGSLRGQFPESAAEYVLKYPIFRQDVDKALTELIDSQKNATFSFSFRTSVHIHINVGSLTEDQLRCFVYTYALLEEPLINFCGKSRKANRFCLRIQDAERELTYIQDFYERGLETLKAIGGDELRYSAMNLGSLYKYGSLEFRGMRGTLDKGVIQTWISALLAMKDWASKHKTPKEIFTHFQEIGPEAFLDEVLGELAPQFVYPKMGRDMLLSCSLSISLPHALLKKRVAAPSSPEVVFSFDKGINIEKELRAQRLEQIVEVRAIPPNIPKPWRDPVERVMVQDHE
jgi:hypothetical protein